MKWKCNACVASAAIFSIHCLVAAFVCSTFGTVIFVGKDVPNVALRQFGKSSHSRHTTAVLHVFISGILPHVFMCDWLNEQLSDYHCGDILVR